MTDHSAEFAPLRERLVGAGPRLIGPEGSFAAGIDAVLALLVPTGTWKNERIYRIKEPTDGR